MLISSPQARGRAYETVVHHHFLITAIAYAFGNAALVNETDDSRPMAPVLRGFLLTITLAGLATEEATQHRLMVGND